jgi:hypothetical protein
MATRNYRQAKRSREESRKKRKHEKLLRKANRGSPDGAVPGSEPVEATPADKQS